MDEQLEFARQAAQRLAGAGIPHMMTGPMAQAVYAAPRMTRDVDFVVACSALDWPYLERWAAHLGVTDLLHELRP